MAAPMKIDDKHDALAINSMVIFHGEPGTVRHNQRVIPIVIHWLVIPARPSALSALTSPRRPGAVILCFMVFILVFILVFIASPHISWKLKFVVCIFDKWLQFKGVGSDIYIYVYNYIIYMCVCIITSDCNIPRVPTLRMGIPRPVGFPSLFPSRSAWCRFLLQMLFGSNMFREKPSCL